MTKDLELQIAKWFYWSKPNNDPLHFIRTYFVHFKTSWNEFCGFECTKCRSTKKI